jgi:uncharacterized protein (DUF305 family)
MKRAVAALAVLAALAGGACGAGEDPVVEAPTGAESSGDSSGQSSAAATDLNEADITFLQGMVPHHEQAIEMAQMASSRAASQEVRDLAERIEGAQDPEITQMNALLQQAGVDTSGGSGGHDAHGGSRMVEHEGMMSEDQMAALENAMGPDFDKLFLTSMIEHHEGAVSTSEAVLKAGSSPEVKELARAILEAQRTEISEMQALLS